ncbi:uncharacterized protein LACBIDRAFT_329758 [Laccaria bicolor S238N-H82]|uniref:Predicted protein n=1 Tax=Laccaria bicolor (strain S238N-H82 / ATCC MYA-4686) TaxID=486041 RepID=B0DJ49_LACBS|nr:uncharacterized protein LACBIDRAFT_329758 [Laccaria bicolor S238N-H82]EDR05460.1 predicted protein [Laccaria bicolor S238N-H82]|eukprot:XP_001884018.1 predicted protein [Laccaria bicolor S238N-H82]
MASGFTAKRRTVHSPRPFRYFAPISMDAPGLEERSLSFYLFPAPSCLSLPSNQGCTTNLGRFRMRGASSLLDSKRWDTSPPDDGYQEAFDNHRHALPLVSVLEIRVPRKRQLNLVYMASL